jgi:predicted metal-binding membrane protein
LELLLRRERLIVGVCLSAIVILSWMYLFHLRSAMEMSGMDMPGMVMVDTERWGPTTLVFLFVMWTVMMIAMMVPSATPMIFTFLALNENRRAASRPLMPVGVFLLGYLAVWTGYSAIATLAEWGLHQRAMLSTTMNAISPALNGVLLIAAGAFQLTPLKRACLQGCRSPLSFLMSEWRNGASGAFIMGLRHGMYCLGCCWILMALLFVAGIMNLLWVAVITVLVMLEKVVPKGEWLGRVVGIGLLVAGITLLVR